MNKRRKKNICLIFKLSVKVVKKKKIFFLLLYLLFIFNDILYSSNLLVEFFFLSLVFVFFFSCVCSQVCSICLVNITIFFCFFFFFNSLNYVRHIVLSISCSMESYTYTRDRCATLPRNHPIITQRRIYEKAKSSHTQFIDIHLQWIDSR